MTTVLTDLATRAEAAHHDLQTASDPTGKEMARRGVVRRVVHLQTDTDADAGTDRLGLAFVGVPASEFPNGAKVVSITMRSTVITPHASTFFTDKFDQYSAAGVKGNSVATLTSDAAVAVGSGGLGAAPTTEGKPYSALLTATVANREIAAGGSLGLWRDKASTGVALQPVSYEIVLEAL